MPALTLPKPDLNNPATLVDPATGLPMTPFEIEQLRHQIVSDINAKRERFRLRAANQAKGFDEPKVGQTYHVQLDGSISRRQRGGLRFERGARVEVKVVSDADFEKIKANAPDAPVVTVHGAERIIEDTAFHVFDRPMEEDAERLRQHNAQLVAELEAAREDAAELRRAMEVMKARRAAPESPEGKPTKLAAQAAVRSDAAPEEKK